MTAVEYILLWMSIAFFIAVGYIANIVQIILYVTDNPGVGLNDLTVLWIVKLVGVLAFPLGAVAGWIGMF